MFEINHSLTRDVRPQRSKICPMFDFLNDVLIINSTFLIVVKLLTVLIFFSGIHRILIQLLFNHRLEQEWFVGVFFQVHLDLVVYIELFHFVTWWSSVMSIPFWRARRPIDLICCLAGVPIVMNRAWEREKDTNESVHFYELRMYDLKWWQHSTIATKKNTAIHDHAFIIRPMSNNPTKIIVILIYIRHPDQTNPS